MKYLHHNILGSQNMFYGFKIQDLFLRNTFEAFTDLQH
ncbi:hypothetical protein FlaCF_0104 [Flavobacterium tructae]